MNEAIATPPETVFANLGEEFEKVTPEELQELWGEAREKILQDTGRDIADPRDQQFIMRLDKKTLIKSEAEYAACQKKNIPLRFGIKYTHALHLLAEESAKDKAKKKRRVANKKARVARKRNRK